MIKYKDKNDIVKDLQFVLNNQENFSKHLLQRILDDLIWSWTETDGKVRGCSYWSGDALEQYRENNWSLKGLKFQHEHSIPRKTLNEWFRSFKDMSLTDLKAILESYVVGVVVTKETHTRLHEYDSFVEWSFLKDASSPNIFARYKLADVEIAKVKWGRKRAPEEVTYLNL